MEIIKDISVLREKLDRERKVGKSIGFVPTMGFFHPGHLELMKEAKRNCEVVVVSIFVNPTQFGPSEDYHQYPQDFARDTTLAVEIGVEYLFTPAKEGVYPEGYSTYVEVERITEPLCGLFRPGHFRGVTTIVTKLFNIVAPNKAYFGKKDYQQYLAVKRVAKDLNFDIEIVGVDTVRDEDGLAASSRNIYLNSDERKQANVLYRSLVLAQQKVKGGARKSEEIKDAMKRLIKKKPLVNLEYLEICNKDTLEPVGEIKNQALVALAARIGRTRLIDNVIVKLES